MDSIFNKVKLASIPVDLLATLRIFFEEASLKNKTLFEQLYVDRWFTYNLPQNGSDRKGNPSKVQRALHGKPHW